MWEGLSTAGGLSWSLKRRMMQTDCKEQTWLITYCYNPEAVVKLHVGDVTLCHFQSWELSLWGTSWCWGVSCHCPALSPVTATVHGSILQRKSPCYILMSWALFFSGTDLSGRKIWRQQKCGSYTNHKQVVLLYKHWLPVPVVSSVSTLTLPHLLLQYILSSVKTQSRRSYRPTGTLRTWWRGNNEQSTCLFMNFCCLPTKYMVGKRMFCILYIGVKFSGLLRCSYRFTRNNNRQNQYEKQLKPV